MGLGCRQSTKPPAWQEVITEGGSAVALRAQLPFAEVRLPRFQKEQLGGRQILYVPKQVIFESEESQAAKPGFLVVCSRK